MFQVEFSMLASKNQETTAAKVMDCNTGNENTQQH